jgi:hypothetical protein
MKQNNNKLKQTVNIISNKHAFPASTTYSEYTQNSKEFDNVTL